MTDKPLLLIDVDGPLNPFAAKPTRRPEGYTTHRLAPKGCNPRKPYRVWLNPGHGRMLLDFAETAGVELVWCTTWEHDANKMIGPVIGLPVLPVIELGFPATRWKFGAVAEYAAGLPLAWLDDDFDEHRTARRWFDAQRADMPTLLHHVDARIGLTDADLDAVAAWAFSAGGVEK